MEPAEVIEVEPAEVIARLAGEPGAAQLLALAPAGAFLVGGAVRDLLLGRTPRELDVVLAGKDAPLQPGEVARLARELAAHVGAAPRTSEHERFDTAVVEWKGGRIDIAAARRERYPYPGALPEVEPATLADDLLRRDFTVNAIAIALVGEQRGILHAAPHALEDLRARRLRSLHPQSFLDDPTRLWRLARYHGRLGFEIEGHTAELAARAVAAGALATVSGARIGAELRLALAEPGPLAALVALDELGLLTALHPRLRFEPRVLTSAIGLLDAGRPGRPDVLALASLGLALTLRAEAPQAGGDRGVELGVLLDRLEFPATVRDAVLAAALAVPRLTDELAQPLRPSQLRAAVLRVPPEGVALAGALGGDQAAAAARRWLGELCDVNLRITGVDLLAAGLQEGPDLGRRLERALQMRLDGELPDERDAQLHAALTA